MTQSSICLIDGSGYIFRAFYALPPMTRPSDGTPVNAVYGFFNMLYQLSISDHCSHMVVIFDAARQNFRNTIYPQYKANRKETPPELIPQFPLIRAACHALNVPCVEMEGYEADDLIATYARIATESGWKARVISADKDLMQLMRENVSLYDPMKHKDLTKEDVIKKFGVPPDKVVDVQALMGDSTDNVPGANGIGPKTAAELIAQFGSVESLYEHLPEIKSEKRRQGLERDKSQVFISKQLVQLDAFVPVTEPLTAFKAEPICADTTLSFLKENGFHSLIKKLESYLARQSETQVSETTSSAAAQPEQLSTDVQGNLFEQAPAQPLKTKSSTEQPTPETAATRLQTLIQTTVQFNQMRQKQANARTLAFYLYAADETQTVPAALTLIFDHKDAYYLPLTSQTSGGMDLFSFNQPETGVSVNDALTYLTDCLANESLLTIGCDLKSQSHLIAKGSRPPHAFKNIADIALQSYALNGTTLTHTLPAMRAAYLNENGTELMSLLGSGRTKVSFDSVPQELKSQACFAEIDAIDRLYTTLSNRLTGTQMQTIYQTLDLPLIPILFEMERAGILVDKNHLKTLDKIFTQEIDRLANQIYELAGEAFNINSPAQIGTILFDKLGLASGKKTSGGQYTTDVKTLSALAENGTEIAQKILDYRQFTKLKSTYVETLTKQTDAQNRVHTTFTQTTTNTGRLASTNPNLQNIPVRSEEGKEIRRSFIAPKGYKIVCADYSQIELRLMAAVADVTQLKESFRQNEDIHTRTASQIFKIPPEQIDADTRRRAKAINFGIIYGISPFGLAAQLGIPQKEAKNYIDAYFEHYPEIKKYMAQTAEQVVANGYVDTPWGRRCFIQGAGNPKTRNFAIRAAINAPIQGGAADIIKRAMIDVVQHLQDTSVDAKLLLQVHDELVFQVKESDVPTVMQLVKETMENAAHLSIPLIADVRAGNDWKEAH